MKMLVFRPPPRNLEGMFRSPLPLFAAACMAATLAHSENATFSFHDEAGQYLDILTNGKPVARYMYSTDFSTPEKRNENFKPYLHVFDAEGKQPITKGGGGLFPHHHGMFIGWNKLTVAGKTYDRWHMKGGEQVHTRFLSQETKGDHASFTSLVSWAGETAAPVLEEERTLIFMTPPKEAYALIEMDSKLKAVGGETKLDGDPEHSGLQFRPANDVALLETVYVFPKEGADAKKDRDYPWVGESFTLRGERYSVVFLNHPTNSKDAVYSAYRDYGRFGAWFKGTIPAGGEQTVRVRFLISKGEMLPTELIEKAYNEFAGTNEPVPKVTVKKADISKPAEPKPAKASGDVPIKP
ncbi:MAG: hypothetical protein JWL59_2817 [Chthoniobacteraceae bacterium]|nr:hypothetical protein [Chthoniobacteraceae bacterium]